MGEVAGGAVAGTGGTNKANLPTRTETDAGGEGTRGAVARGDCAKRTQFAPPRPERRCPAGPEALPTRGAIAPNKANLPRGQGWAQDRQGRPCRPRWGQNVRNKPNSRRSIGCEQVLVGKRVMTNRTCNGHRPNKANFRPNRSGQGPARLPVPPVEPSVPNKANLPRSDRPKAPTGRDREHCRR